MQLGKAIEQRKSVRRFSPKKPNIRDIIDAVDAARLAPMAGNILSTKFIIIDDTKTIAKLAAASQQPFIADAQYVVAVASNTMKTKISYENRADRYIRQQAGAAIQNFLLTLEEKGLATCWIGHFVDYLVMEALKISDGVQIEALFPIGYEKRPAGRRRNKVALDRILYFNKYGKKIKDRLPSGTA